MEDPRILRDYTAGRFQMRAAGAILHNGCVLVHKAEGDLRYSLPGGRVEFGETAERTLAREFEEEMGVALIPGRLFCVNENFFTWKGVFYHELGFYYLVPPSEELLKKGESFEGDEHGARLSFCWVPAEKLSGAIFPQFLEQMLPQPAEGVAHIITHE